MDAFRRQYNNDISFIDLCTKMVQTDQTWQQAASDLAIPVCYDMSTAALHAEWLFIPGMDQQNQLCHCCDPYHASLTCHYWFKKSDYGKKICSEHCEIEKLREKERTVNVRTMEQLIGGNGIPCDLMTGQDQDLYKGSCSTRKKALRLKLMSHPSDC